MTNYIYILQQAIQARLVSDAALISHLRGNKIFDDVPRQTKLPYIVHRAYNLYDWNTSTEDGAEIHFELQCWAKNDSKHFTTNSVTLIRTALETELLELEGADLVNFLCLGIEFHHEKSRRQFWAQLRYRAVLEPVTSPVTSSGTSEDKADH